MNCIKRESKGSRSIIQGLAQERRQKLSRKLGCGALLLLEASYTAALEQVGECRSTQATRQHLPQTPFYTHTSKQGTTCTEGHAEVEPGARACSQRTMHSMQRPACHTGERQTQRNGQQLQGQIRRKWKLLRNDVMQQMWGCDAADANPREKHRGAYV